MMEQAIAEAVAEFTATRLQGIIRPPYRLKIHRLQKRQFPPITPFQLPQMQSGPLLLSPGTVRNQDASRGLVENAALSRTPLHAELEAATAAVQARLEQRFGIPFEVVVSRSDFSSISHFFGNFMCKIKYSSSSGAMIHRAPRNLRGRATRQAGSMPLMSLENASSVDFLLPTLPPLPFTLPPPVLDTHVKCNDTRVLLAYAAPMPELEYCAEKNYGGLGVKVKQGVNNVVRWEREGPNPLLPERLRRMMMWRGGWDGGSLTMLGGGFPTLMGHDGSMMGMMGSVAGGLPTMRRRWGPSSEMWMGPMKVDRC